MGRVGGSRVQSTLVVVLLLISPFPQSLPLNPFVSSFGSPLSSYSAQRKPLQVTAWSAETERESERATINNSSHPTRRTLPGTSHTGNSKREKALGGQGTLDNLARHLLFSKEQASTFRITVSHLGSGYFTLLAASVDKGRFIQISLISSCFAHSTGPSPSIAQR